MIIKKEVFKNGLKFNNNFIKWSYGEDLMLSYQIYIKYGKGSLMYFPDLKFKHFAIPISRIKNKEYLKMKILYRYIFWKSEKYKKNF